MSQSTYQNNLVRHLSPQDFERLRRHLEPVPLKARQVLIQRNALVPYIYFPESGQASVLAKVTGSEPIEVGMFGREGMSDMAPSRKVPLETVMQIEGHGHRVEREVYSQVMSESVGLANLTSCWQHAQLVQTAFTALSHGSFTVVERLARSLLMIHDRVEGDEMPLVHDHFAWMLAVRRAGVTEAFRTLKDAGGVWTGRAMVRIVDRQALVDAAHGSYGAAEAEYEKLFGCPLSKQPSQLSV
ncbi:MAG TPA: Crp/Fnr family transcriptional regulator [Beijerinckiaceae bacterium]|jgi:CRP-like cAMP-binding protein